MRGFALPLVLWLIATLMTMVGVLAYAAKVGHIESRTQFDRVEAEAAARAGIVYAVARTDRGLGSEAWGPSMTPRRLRFEGWDITVNIRDESGKFDLNRGDPQLLRALLQLRQVPAGQAARLVERLESQRRGETALAAAAPPLPGAPASAGDKPGQIVSVSELRQWPGIAPATLDAIAGELTVNGASGQPEWRLASPLMRQALAATGVTGVDAAPTTGPEFGSGTYAIESIAERPGKPPGRIVVVLRVFPRGSGDMASTWLAWEHGKWQQ
ncbi:type II secretion system protein GspK [Solilutibacter pythonis]|uniref:type II secretion system protein GspK n=1 Tax=Solilutibacter pythonis TaxID=2483112 RepID=UPI00131402B5|nr:type II secretion system protein GspK [Lysobacter pythonis]